MKVCHVSILNPVFHSRIYFKWALSQLKQGHEVWIIAQQQRPPHQLHENLHIIPFPSFARMGWGRVKAHQFIFRELTKLQPEVVIIHSPELLWLVGRMKNVLFHYDVHEDYRKNILYGQAYPKSVRRILAEGVRKMELFFRHKLQSVTYAEECYENILEVPKGRFLVLENRCRIRDLSLPDDQIPFDNYLLYSGTIAEAWGIWECLSFWEVLNRERMVPLVIAGHTHYPSLVEEIQAFVRAHHMEEQFLLVGGTDYVAYHQILTLIKGSAAILGLYHDLPQIRGKMPTKFFEAMAYGKPVIFTPLEEWVDFNERHYIGVPYVKEKDSPIKVWEKVKVIMPRHAPEHWEWEEKKLAQFMGQHYFTKK